jgi:hypothetical protein
MLCVIVSERESKQQNKLNSRLKVIERILKMFSAAFKSEIFQGHVVKGQTTHTNPTSITKYFRMKIPKQCLKWPF